MDFDANLFLNYIPIISAITLTIVACVTIFITLRNRRPVKVNCWFCNENTKVPRQSVSWWFCPHCEQYNGFSKNGDYNYEIPEQHEIINKSNTKQDSYCQRKDYSESQNSLCKDCNKREELKLLKLRELEDSTDVYNDKKFTQFEKSFEKKYPLCMKCQNVVQRVLHKQALWLTQYKMLLFKQKPIKRIIQNKEKIERILRIVLSILASVTIYFTEAWYLPLCGIFFQLAACLACPTDKRQSDILPILGWACLLWVNAFSTTAILEILNISSMNDWTLVNDNNTYQYFIVTLGTAVGLANLRFHSHKTISNGNLTFKKLESPNRNVSLSRSSSPEPATMPIKEKSCNKEPRRNLYSPVNITDTLMTPSAVETPIPLKPTNVPQWSFQENRSSPPNLFSYRASAFAPDMENSFSKSYNSQSYSLNDSLTSLNSLSLGNSQKLLTSHSPKVFKTKVYGTTSPDIFTRQLRYNPKRSILAPPKLRSITQTSWVAGGYWQSGMDVPTLSRSSSQSSGFGSSGSNCGPSCEPSVHEFDQCSVLSDGCYFARPETPLSGRNSTVLKRRSNNSSLHNTQTTDMGCDSESLQHIIRSQTQCNGHTTIITNPVWLPVLLCGSLLFNMVVLCTILMR